MIFVIDACIAYSMGSPNAIDPISQNCRKTLIEIFNHSHKIAVNDKLFDEYRRNGSRFFEEWFLIMLSKGRVENLNECKNPQLRDQIKTSICNNITQSTEQHAVLSIICKDVHLIEVALATDKFVISNDNKCRRNLIRLMKFDVKKLGLGIIIWAVSDEDLLTWFQQGANIHKVSGKWLLN